MTDVIKMTKLRKEFDDLDDRDSLLQTPTDREGRDTFSSGDYVNGTKTKTFGCGGLDLNQRPLGYEPEETRLSNSFFGTSGTLRTFQEAPVSAIGGLKGACPEQPL